MRGQLSMRGAARFIVLVLVLANLGYFAWSRGSFAALGFQPAGFGETEPHRLERQVRPELLQIRKTP